MQANLTLDNITLPMGVGVALLPALSTEELKRIWSLSKDKAMQLPDISTRHAAVAGAFGALQVICCLVEKEGSIAFRFSLHCSGPG
jgi:hypothetical protein